MIDPRLLYSKLQNARIKVSGCDGNGTVWDDNHKEIQTRKDIQKIISSIKANEEIPTIESRLSILESEKEVLSEKIDTIQDLIISTKTIEKLELL